MTEEKWRQFHIPVKRAVLLAVVLLSALFVVPSRVHASTGCDLVVSQAIHVKGAYSKPFFPLSYSLEAVNGTDPLPKGGVNGAYRFSIKGNSNKTLTIHYDGPGVYSYRLYQHRPDPKLGYSHDKSIYHIHITVMDTRSGRVVKMRLLKYGASHKPTEILFTNSFVPPLGKDPHKGVKTGDTGWLLAWIWIALAAAVLSMLVFGAGRRKGALLQPGEVQLPQGLEQDHDHGV